MQNNEILCLIDMFDVNAEVILPDNSRENIPVKGIFSRLYDICESEQIYTLHLLGNKKYLEGLANENPPINYGVKERIEVKIN